MSVASTEGEGQNLNPKWWYLYNEAYDFSDFVQSHPGGKQAISLGRGRDCTALFESYHTFLPSPSLLKQYKIDGDKVATKGYPTKINHTMYTYNESGFYRTVKRRAREYFRQNNLSSFRGDIFDTLMWILNVVCFFFFGYRACVKGNYLAAIITGVCKSLLVIRSTHAASHYSFSNSDQLNRFVYWFNMCLLGDTPAQWTAKHVLAHHIDTNLTPVDDDTMYPIKRVLDLPHLWYHQYQHYYIWLMYGFVFIPWSLSHTIKLIYGYMSGVIYEGTVPVRLEEPLDHIETISACLIGWLVTCMPLITLPMYQFSWIDTLMVVVLFQVSSGLWFSLQFAVNHEVPESVDGSGSGALVWDEQRDWGVHQMLTSHNYSPDSALSLHLSGGLNYQIEHHLFPAVHYKYYPALSKIIKQTAHEFNVPYIESNTFIDGVVSHTQLLRKMGAKPKQ